MGTGIDSEFGKLYSWNHWNQTPYYQDECGKIRGSAGEFFAPSTVKEYVNFFSPDLCRSMRLDLRGEAVVANVLGNKYSVEANMLDNGKNVFFIYILRFINLDFYR